MRRYLIEPLRFAIVGFIGFVVDAGVLALLLAVFPEAVVLARIPSFLLAATVTWWLHRHFTFPLASRHGARLRQWVAFVVTNGSGNAINFLTYALLAKLAGWPPLGALALASVLAAGVNYVASRTLVFRRSRTPDP